MKCLFSTCNNTIPTARKRSSKYCSDDCYYAAKKDRSLKRYAVLKGPAEAIRQNEQLLSYLYSIAELNKPLSLQDLETLSFNFGISTGEHLDNNRRLFRVVGMYAWYSDGKNLVIMKVKN